MTMSGNQIGNRIARPLTACAVSAAWGLAILLESADVHAQQFEIIAEAAADADASRRFVILSLSQEGAEEDPLRERAIAYIHRGLIVAKFVAAETVEDADIAIAFSYGIGAPEFQPRSAPPRARLPSAGYPEPLDTTIIDAQAYTNAIVSSSIVLPVPVTLPYTPILDNTTQPALRVPAQVPEILSTPTPTTAPTSPGTYPVFLELVAYDLQAYRDANQSVRLWRTVVYVLARDVNLDELLPVMLAGGRRYFGTDHDERRFAHVEANSRRVRYIRGESQTP